VMLRARKSLLIMAVPRGRREAALRVGSQGQSIAWCQSYLIENDQGKHGAN
jgi:hypothetical protein